MLLLSVLSGVLLAGSTAKGEVGEATRLKATIDQWMAVMGDLQGEERRWANEREVLEDSIEGLTAEIEQIDEEIGLVKERLDNADSSSKEKLAEKEKFDAAREFLAAELDGLEAVVAEVVPLIPTFFVRESSKLARSIEELEKHRAAEDKSKLGLNQRLSPLVQILTETERFNQKIWPVDEQLDVDGVPKKMRVAYLGLGVAYAVDGDASVALIGHPGADGWTFNTLGDADVARNVQEMIGAADNTGESKVVTLPVKLAQ